MASRIISGARSIESTVAAVTPSRPIDEPEYYHILRATSVPGGIAECASVFAMTRHLYLDSAYKIFIGLQLAGLLRWPRTHTHTPAETDRRRVLRSVVNAVAKLVRTSSPLHAPFCYYKPRSCRHAVGALSTRPSPCRQMRHCEGAR